MRHRSARRRRLALRPLLVPQEGVWLFSLVFGVPAALCSWRLLWCFLGGEQFSARGFVQAAQTIAVREHQQRIAPAHLLKALLDDEQGMAAGLIQAAGGDAKIAQREADALVAKIPAVTGSGATQAPAMDGDTIRILDQVRGLTQNSGTDQWCEGLIDLYSWVQALHELREKLARSAAVHGYDVRGAGTVSGPLPRLPANACSRLA